jgi:hypothetical protein
MTSRRLDSISAAAGLPPPRGPIAGKSDQSAVQEDIPNIVLQHWHAPASEQEAVPVIEQAGHEDATHEPPLLDPEPPSLDPPHARHVPDPHAATASASTA